jgi:hypothetical protein
MSRIPQLLVLLFIFLTTLSGQNSLASAEDQKPIDIGSRLELFVDDFLIDKMDNSSLKLHPARDEGIAFKFDKPWEGAFCGYVTMIKDGTRYRAYYRGLPEAGKDGRIDETTCIAESSDGITWNKPVLNQYDYNGSKKNNIIFAKAPPFSHNFCPMLDSRKDVSPSERYKALGGSGKSGLFAFISADGYHWKKMSDKPVITEGAFDSQNVPFWSESEKKYVCYFRVFADGFRRISRTSSTDFIHWSKPVMMEYGGKPIEHLYTNQTSPYFRAPHIYVAIAARFFPRRRVLSDAQAKAINVHPKYFNDCSDGIFMTTRGGNQYDRTFMDGFIRPGIGVENWVSRTNYPALNVVPTGKSEISVYVNQNYGQPTAHLRRYSLRADGFASVSSSYDGGEMTTKPFVFKGGKLVINFSTSAAGEIFVEIQDQNGKPFPGYSLKDSVVNIGNEVDRTVYWKKGTDVSSLSGKTIRLKFKLKDADLYSLKFE